MISGELIDVSRSLSRSVEHVSIKSGLETGTEPPEGRINKTKTKEEQSARAVQNKQPISKYTVEIWPNGRHYYYHYYYYY